MRRIAAMTALLLALWPLAGGAGCAGRDLLDDLPADVRAGIEARAAAVPFPEGRLWRAERDGAVVHVAGTLHVGDARLTPVMRRLAPLVAGSALVLVEMTLAEAETMRAAIADRPGLAYLTGPTGLGDRLGPVDAGRYVAEMGARGVPPQVADRMRPWLALAMLSVPACLLEGVGQAPGLDAQVIGHAVRAGVPVASLEPFTTTIGLLDGLAEDEALDLLRLALRQAEVSEDLFATRTAAYFAGTPRLAWELSRSWPPGADRDRALHDRLEEVLLRRRNRAWVDRVEAAADRGPLFVAVGAAHLSGHDGLLDLLDRAGWRLRRLDIAPRP